MRKLRLPAPGANGRTALHLDANQLAPGATIEVYVSRVFPSPAGDTCSSRPYLLTVPEEPPEVADARERRL